MNDAWLVQHTMALENEGFFVVAALSRKSMQELRAQRKRRKLWLQTPQGKLSVRKSQLRNKKIREGRIRVDSERSRTARLTRKLYG